jgi:hypothetical protein
MATLDGERRRWRWRRVRASATTVQTGSELTLEQLFEAQRQRIARSLDVRGDRLRQRLEGVIERGGGAMEVETRGSFGGASNGEALVTVFEDKPASERRLYGAW